MQQKKNPRAQTPQTRNCTEKYGWKPGVKMSKEVNHIHILCIIPFPPFSSL